MIEMGNALKIIKKSLIEQMAEKEAEISRLRAALEKIANEAMHNNNCVDQASCLCFEEFAKKALAEGTEGK